MKVSASTPIAVPPSAAKSEATPPGLARRELELPPGIAKKLERGGELPAGIAKRFPITPVPTEPATPPVAETETPAEGGVDIVV